MSIVFVKRLVLSFTRLSAHWFWRVILGVLLAGLPLRLGRADITEKDDVIAWLDIQQLSRRVASDTSAVLNADPESISRFLIHLPHHGSNVSYGTIHTKVNTEAADLGVKSVGYAEGIVLQLDLSAAGGFLFKQGRNSVELEYQDQFGRPSYFSFILDFPHKPDRDLILSSDVPDSSVTPPLTRRGKLYAVVIGISHYLDPSRRLPNLHYADKDAEAFAEFLKSPAGGSIIPDNMLLLLNESATAQGIRSALFTFLTRPKAEDTVVIYLAGHGADDPHDRRNLYFLAADTNPYDMGGTAFPMWQMQDVFARVIKANRVLTIADTCHSYGFTGAEKMHGNNLFNQYMEHFGSIHQQAVITASDTSELSWEGEHYGHGIFTYFLLRGLHGEADGNHDGVVTAGEIFAYLRRTVSKETEGRQNPRAMAGLANSLVVSVLQTSHVQADPRPKK